MNQMKEGATYSLAECGVLTALSVALVLIAGYVPVIGSLVMLVWAVPLIALVMRRGLRWGVISAVVVTLLSVFLTGPFLGVIAGLTLGVFGLVYGVAFKKGASPQKTLLFGTIAAGLLTIVTLGITVAFGNISIEGLFSSFKDAFLEVFAMYEKMGVLEDMIPAGYTAATYVEEMLSVFYRLIPGAFVVIAMGQAVANYLFSALILRKFHFEIKPLPPFREWHMPWWLMWGVALIFLGYLMGKQFDNDTYFSIALNLLYIYLPIFLVAGISLMTYFFHAFHLSRGVQVFIWVLAVLLSSFSLFFLVFMGAVDTLVDYRKYRRKALERKSDSK